MRNVDGPRRGRVASAGVMPPSPPTERQVQRTCVALLRRIGFTVYVFSDRRRVVTPGIPDLYVMHPGRGIAGWLEIKAPGGQLRPEQVIFAAACKRAGVLHLVVDSMDTFWTWLREMGLFAETG